MHVGRTCAGICSSAATHTSPVALEQVSARTRFALASSGGRRGLSGRDARRIARLTSGLRGCGCACAAPEAAVL